MALKELEILESFSQLYFSVYCVLNIVTWTTTCNQHLCMVVTQSN